MQLSNKVFTKIKYDMSKTYIRAKVKSNKKKDYFKPLITIYRVVFYLQNRCGSKSFKVFIIYFNIAIFNNLLDNNLIQNLRVWQRNEVTLIFI